MFFESEVVEFIGYQTGTKYYIFMDHISSIEVDEFERVMTVYVNRDHVGSGEKGYSCKFSKDFIVRFKEGV